MSSRLQVRTTRLDANRIRIDTPSRANHADSAGLPMLLFANEHVPIDRSSLAEAGALSGIGQSSRALADAGFFGGGGSVRRCVFTPDFHKGAGIPIGSVVETQGFVFPRAAGGDIGCGMRLVATDMTRAEFDALDSGLDAMLRRAFFEGGRDLPLSEAGREAMLRHGVPGLADATGGLWDGPGGEALRAEATRCHGGGSWPTEDLWMFGDYVRGSGGTSRDATLGSIGGGNHFVELQWLAERIDPGVAWRWGLRTDAIAIMVHSGSVGLGSQVGDHFMRLAQDLHPAGLARAPHGFHPLPLRGPHARHGEAYLSAMGLAANFAVANRLALALMALDCLSRAAGRKVRGQLVYDAPHNVAWRHGDRVVHRKGACPADCDMADPAGARSLAPDFPDGIPVIVPGSMGAPSWLLCGLGLEESLCSAPHGAGRVASRGEGRRASPTELSALRLVTKVDRVRVRRDVAEEIARDLLEEAPSMYKPGTAVVQTCADAGLAAPVAVLQPLLTVKG